jgi:hypothetical protein
MKIAVMCYGRLGHHNLLDVLGDHELFFFLSSDNSPDDELQEFIRVYKPIKYINDKIEDPIKLEKYFPETNIDHMVRHFKNKERVFSLLDDNLNVDCVLSVRLDLYYESKFNIQNCENDTIYIPSGNDYRGGINDQIAYGSYESMKVYMNLYNNIKNLNSIIHPENLTLANIKQLNIKRFDLKYKIVRNY